MKKVITKGSLQHPTNRRIFSFTCKDCGAVFKTNEIVRQFVDCKPRYISACPMCGHPCITDKLE